ncbi:MAG: M16 family metallopeptidase [Pyrinomonadaceae bacterium]
MRTDIKARIMRRMKFALTIAALFSLTLISVSAQKATTPEIKIAFQETTLKNGLRLITGDDRTAYFETVPSNQLDLSLFLESDRLRGLSITQAGLDTERNVVQEEKRLSFDNQPYAKGDQVLNELLYENFAYKHGVIGSMENLNAASLKDVSDFFKIYYAPNNLVLVLVGDFKTVDAAAKVRKYFETIPRQPASPALDLTEPEQKAERRATVEDELANAPQVNVAFKAARGNTPDFYALQILASVLGSGQSSRLYQEMVKQSEMVSEVYSFMSERRGVGAFQISATLRPGKTTADVEAAIYKEIERLRNVPISDEELQKAKNTLAYNFDSNLQRSLIRGIDIGEYAILYDDPNLVNTRLDKISAVTKEDVERVANKYLKQTNRVVVITVPKAKTAAVGTINERGKK